LLLTLKEGRKEEGRGREEGEIRKGRRYFVL